MCYTHKRIARITTENTPEPKEQFSYFNNSSYGIRTESESSPNDAHTYIVCIHKSDSVARVECCFIIVRYRDWTNLCADKTLARWQIV